MSSERSFFQAMEEFGFFQHIYESLPAEFTAVFEIARVLEDEDSQLAIQLRSVLKLASFNPESQRETLEDHHRYVPVGEEYEAEMIQSHRDVARVYPSQYLLPDEVFLQRLAERTLWMPTAREPRILPIESVDAGFSYDSKKQKVYILFDTSSSMTSHHRIHLAKAILYYFLKRNREEMGYIAIRTFDEKVGELHTALDQKSYEALLRYVLRISHLGDGTVLQRAILQALDDISAMEHLAGAEILIITDGAVTLDEALVRSKMDERVKLHAIKIGHAQAIPSEAVFEDSLRDGKGMKDRALSQLVKQEDELKHQLQHAQAPDRRSAFERNLQRVQHEIRERKAFLGKDFQLAYGHELERLAEVYVNLDDFSETHIFKANDETIADLEALTESLLVEASEFVTPELTKKIAVLHDHLAFLQKWETDAALSERLKAMDEKLRALLSAVVGETAQQDQPAVAGTPAATASVPMSDEDLRDLRFILEMGDGKDGGWGLLLRWLWKAAVRKFTGWKRKKST